MPWLRLEPDIYHIQVRLPLPSLFYTTIYKIFTSSHFNFPEGPEFKNLLPDSPELGPCSYLTQL